MKNLNVLIIEDEIIIYMHMQNILKQLGFQNIFLAKNYGNAVEIGLKNKVDLIFSDIHIDGEIDGIDTVKKLQTFYNIPVIFITAYNDSDTISKLSSVDFVGFLLKPYRQADLDVLIRLAISKHDLLSTKKIVLIDNNYKFNIENTSLFYNDEKVKLSKKEKLFFKLLIENLNSIVNYDLIESFVWTEKVVNNTARRTFFHRTKNKFKELNFKIESKNGIGLFTK